MLTRLAGDAQASRPAQVIRRCQARFDRPTRGYWSSSTPSSPHLAHVDVGSARQRCEGSAKVSGSCISGFADQPAPPPRPSLLLLLLRPPSMVHRSRPHLASCSSSHWPACRPRRALQPCTLSYRQRLTRAARAQALRDSCLCWSTPAPPSPPFKRSDVASSAARGAEDVSH